VPERGPQGDLAKAFRRRERFNVLTLVSPFSLSASITLRTNGEMGLPITTYDICAPRRRMVAERQRYISRVGSGKSSLPAKMSERARKKTDKAASRHSEKEEAAFFR
jgi:hypothetical protein